MTLEVGEQRIERWSEDDRVHTITYVGGRPRAEQVTDARGSRVRFAPDWRVRDVPGGGPRPEDDPVARYRTLLDRAGAADVDEIEFEGSRRLPADRPSGRSAKALPQVVILRRRDKLPIEARFGATTLRFRDVEWGRDRSVLDLCHTPPGGSSERPCDSPSSSPDAHRPRPDRRARRRDRAR